MNKLWEKAILFLISAALGIILMLQFQTSQSIAGNNYSLDQKVAELNNELAKLNVEKNELSEEIKKLEEEAYEREKISTSRENEIIRIEEELKKQKILSGYYDVKGRGTIITIDAEPGAYVNLAYGHQHILALISYLNNAGVEAISINGQRYTNYTEIVPVLDHINVNGVALVLPLEIKAIGNSRTIDASLNFVGGIVSQMKEIGFSIESQSYDEIQINKFDGEKEFKYAEPLTVEEQ